MLLLILGVVLWSLVHMLRYIAPEFREKLGQKRRAIISLLVVLSLALMVVGYKAASYIPLWYPPHFLVHVNNLLMIGAVYLFIASGARVRIIRHPQLTAVKLWAVAHLLVNGDLASVILFGGMLAWAVVNVIMINRTQPNWEPPPPPPVKKEFTTLAITLVSVIVIMAIHYLLGVSPLGLPSST